MNATGNSKIGVSKGHFKMAGKFGGLLEATKQQSILHDLYGFSLIIFINIVHWDASNGGP